MTARDNILPEPTGFFRIEVVWYQIETRPKLGFLRSAWDVLEARELSEENDYTLRGLLQWFDRNLAAPKKLNKIAAIFCMLLLLFKNRKLCGSQLSLTESADDHNLRTM